MYLEKLMSNDRRVVMELEARSKMTKFGSKPDLLEFKKVKLKPSDQSMLQNLVKELPNKIRISRTDSHVNFKT